MARLYAKVLTVLLTATFLPQLPSQVTADISQPGSSFVDFESLQSPNCQFLTIAMMEKTAPSHSLETCPFENRIAAKDIQPSFLSFDEMGQRIQGLLAPLNQIPASVLNASLKVISEISRIQEFSRNGPKKLLIASNVAFRKATVPVRPERMDDYWNYYNDCDRWKVVFAKPAKSGPNIGALGAKPKFELPKQSRNPINPVRIKFTKPQTKKTTQTKGKLGQALDQLMFRLIESDFASAFGPITDTKSLSAF